MSERAEYINSICRRLNTCETELRVSKTENIDGVWEPTSLNLVAAILDDLRREVCQLADSEYVKLNAS